MAVDLLGLTPMVRKVVESVHASFPTHHSKDDTNSTLWVWILENKNTVTDLVRNGDRGKASLYHLMKRAANQHLKNEDQIAYAYSPEDVFTYSLDVVKELLKDVFEYEDWQPFGSSGDGQPRRKAQANETGNRVAMLADLKVAIEKLDADQAELIRLTYQHHWTAEMIGSELDISPEAAKKRVQRAVGAVQRRLGGKPYSDLRLGFSSRGGQVGNAEAQYITERDYEG